MKEHLTLFENILKEIQIWAKYDFEDTVNTTQNELPRNEKTYAEFVEDLKAFNINLEELLYSFYQVSYNNILNQKESERINHPIAV